ncbi:hypothetical protein C8A01DRAFT_39754 [Parachaetomium inaequale]|uniref:Uncharacterized protein n=1 Tax=Parachaetomium inaequale TaxID=2588326 RepID=A0AAN6P8P0_9PEZI|nr:hypothetical protein C8A01DRAFT_39754 [Parachaetomium inaequale]
MVNPADVLTKQLLELPQGLIRRFVPKDEHSIYHPVCERFWGSVDVAIRQIRWSTEQPGVSWMIRDFGSTAKVPYAGCTACSRATKYSSASGALQHLHAEHFECPFGASAAVGAQAWAHDDPCYAYMESAADTHLIEPEIENIAKEFIGHISDFLSGLNRIQWLVARNSQGSAQRRRLVLNVHQPPPSAPPLPRSLVYAFDELVAYYLLQVKRLSLQNRAIGLGMRNNAEQESLHALNRSTRMAFRCRDIRGRVLGYLQQAHRDVILAGSGRGGPDGDGDDADTALGVQAFGSTSLVRVLVMSALHTSFSAPLAQKEAAAAARVGSSKARLAGPQDPAWDMVGVYSQYSKHLHEQAARRPRRRLFLDIHAVEDELEGDTVGADGGRLAGAQGNEWKRRYLEERTMEVERHCLLVRRHAGQAKLYEVQRLKLSAGALRERVRQLIEVTDEDHGKAIRVFTIVTVLFLPMTSVSGFFGMNTIDIRDIGATQFLYWTIAIPVTVVVLAIALVYGYKGEEIGDWIEDRIRPRIATWLPSRTEAAEPSTTDGFQVKWDGTGAGVKEVWTRT